MRKIKHIYTWFAAVVLAVGGGVVTSCNDDMPAESYYVFTGEYLSDFLQNHEDYSLFTEIVTRAADSERGVDLMELLHSYGRITCFAPTNEAVVAYLQKAGYSSVADIPVNLCDTLARTHFVNGDTYRLTDLMDTTVTSVPRNNMNGRPLLVGQQMSSDPSEERKTLVINGKSEVIASLADHTVENGIVHPLRAVINLSNATMDGLLGENPVVGLFNQALYLTGLAEIMATKIEDASWNPDLYGDKRVYSGAQWDYCHIPETKKYGFTIFACPDDVLEEKYGITDMQSFYDYARNIYYPGGGWEMNVSDPANADKLKERACPLRRLVGYHCLDRKLTYDKLTTICMINRKVANPTEWYSTMDSLSTIKVERLYRKDRVADIPAPELWLGADDVEYDIYLNRGDRLRGDFDRGIHVLRTVEGDYLQDALNGMYYLTDGLTNYGQEVKDRIFNTRIRMDLYTFFPELANNDIRSEKTNGSINDTSDPNGPAPNYWFPTGYLDNVKVNEDAIFLYQGCHNTFWSYEGDEFNLASEVNNYDITFNLPSVPEGTYQIRLGFAPMTTRGICQFYLDGEARGIPFDMRYAAGDNLDLFKARTGWERLSTMESWNDDDLFESYKKNMHNLGWYHGPKGVLKNNTEGVKDENVTTGTLFCDESHTMRYVLCTTDLKENKQHTIRIKSVWAVGTAIVMLDYIELVPKSVFNNPNKPEDDY